ncbi:hypothetical protein, partial [[Clostridium] aminophilum]|uniref:hypothetical protein n=1 Tax=[Clostridium] aminophilum TaxID=1526 RepID=UPI00332903FE
PLKAEKKGEEFFCEKMRKWNGWKFLFFAYFFKKNPDRGAAARQTVGKSRKRLKGYGRFTHSAAARRRTIKAPWRLKKPGGCVKAPKSREEGRRIFL